MMTLRMMTMMMPRAGRLALPLLLLAACAPAIPSPAAKSPTTQPRDAGADAGADAAQEGGMLVLMGTTDLHGWVLPYDYYTGKRTNNGLASLVPMIDSVRAANPGRTVLVEPGALLQGNPLDFGYSRLQAGETHPVVAAMNLVGYDAAAIGNHEFNYGIPHLQT